MWCIPLCHDRRKSPPDSLRLGQASCGAYVAAWDWQRVKQAMKAGHRRLTNQFLILPGAAASWGSSTKV